MLKIEMKTGNAYFREEDGGLCSYAVAKILREVAEKIENGRTEGKIIDGNGNCVGSFVLED